MLFTKSESSGKRICSDFGFLSPEFRKGRLEIDIQNGLWNGVLLLFFFFFLSFPSLDVCSFNVAFVREVVNVGSIFEELVNELGDMVFVSRGSVIAEEFLLVIWLELWVAISTSPGTSSFPEIVVVSLFAVKSSNNILPKIRKIEDY